MLSSMVIINVFGLQAQITKMLPPPFHHPLLGSDKIFKCPKNVASHTGSEIVL